MKKEDLYFQSGDKKTKIHSVIWKPDNFNENINSLNGIIQIVHGMTEYIERYSDFAEYFTNLGYIVCGIDLVGHGESYYNNNNINKDNGIINVDNYENWVSDIEILRNKMINQYNNYNHLTNEYYNPTYIMIGFSLGSFILRAHQLHYPNSTNKLIYIGTGNPDINSLKFAKLIIKFIFFKEKESRIVKYMAFDIYNKGLKENQDKQAAWLIKNDNIRNEYLRDKNVHLKMTPRFFNEFLKCMIYVCSNENNNLNLYDDSVLFLIWRIRPSIKYKK